MTALRATLLARRRWRLSAFGTSLDASAQAYPNQVVRIVVPFSAGSITDGLARILADKLGELWKQQVIVENRPGLPGTTAVAKSAPDGYTLMLTSNGHAIASAINKNIQFDPVKDFAGVSRVAAVPLVAIVPPDFPGKTLKDFIALANEKPAPAQFLLGRDCQHLVSVGRDFQAGCQDQHPARALQGRARGHDRRHS